MAVHDFKSQRLFIEQDLAEHAEIPVSREQANYLLNVLRMKDGGEILVFNGRDGEWSARIQVQGRKKCSLKPQQKIRPQPRRPGLVYCFAPLKQARLDYMIQKAVEMGAGELRPVITRFTQIRTINPKRMHANAVEAAEQCGVLNLPEIHEPVPLAELMTALGSGLPLVFCDENANAANDLQELGSASPQRVAVLIGPEGGFSDEEREMLCAQDNVYRLGLGPRILRADTAAVAALALVQSTLGDWIERNDRQQ